MQCPKCKKEMILRKGKFGDFFGCQNYPRCKMTMPVKGIVEKKELRRIKTPSNYQAAIFEFVKSNQKHALIRATAGSGKTTVQEHTCAILLEDLGIPADDIIYLAFNSHVVKEAVEKGLPAKSTHQVGRAAIADYTKDRIELDENKVSDIVKNLIQTTWDEEKWMISPICQIVSKLKNTLAPTDNATLEKICDKFGIEVNGSSDRIFELTRQALELNNKSFNRIDFDDMLYLPIRFKMPIKQYKWVLGDEVQDWNRAQIELIQRLVAPGGRVLAVGDENQCQPAGTKIIVSKGPHRWSKKTLTEKNIEDIKEGDFVLSRYRGNGSTFVKGQLVTGVAKRFYSGNVYSVSCDGKETKATQNHKWIVKWDKSIKDKYCVYILQKGDWFRVGCHKLFSRNSDLSILNRLRQERADKVWILKVFEDKKDALIYEQYISYQYGIPQLLFYRDYPSPLYDEQFISEVFDTLGRHGLYQRVIACFDAHNRSIDYPFSERGTKEGQRKRGFNCTFIVHSCNLLAEYMLIPSVDLSTLNSSKIKSNWAKFEIKTDWEDLEVYSLNVAVTETYVANGIITHNSMYGFRGAAMDAMQNIEKAFSATILPLSISYRNPSSHVDLINRVFPNIAHEKSPFAKQGEILEMSQDKMLGILRDGDLVICRNNAPLVEPVFTLIRQGIKATIRGRDIGKNLVSLVERFNVKNTDELLEKLETYRIKEVAKLMKAEKTNQAQALDDKVATIVALSEGTEWTWQITQKINEVFSDKKEGVIFSTVHRAKGDEAERVFILNPQLMPSKYAKTEESLTQEANILFVALSRSKHLLAFVGGPAPAAFESQEMWEEDEAIEQLVIGQVSEILPEGSKLFTNVEVTTEEVKFEKEITVNHNIQKCPF